MYFNCALFLSLPLSIKRSAHPHFIPHFSSSSSSVPARKVETEGETTGGHVKTQKLLHAKHEHYIGMPKT